MTTPQDQTSVLPVSTESSVVPANGDVQTLRLLERLIDSDLEVRDLARELGMNLRELGGWMIDPANALAVEGLLRLADVRTHMALCRYRAAAATILVKIASEQEPGDLVRKACVDLLTIDPGEARTRGRVQSPSPANRNFGDSAIPSASPAISEEAIVRALQAIGERDDD